MSSIDSRKAKRYDAGQGEKRPRVKPKRKRNLKEEGGRWYFDFSYKGKRYIRLGGRTKEEARDAMDKLRLELKEGPKPMPADVEDPYFDDFAKEYIEIYAKQHKRSWRRDEFSIARLNAFIGRRCLSEISLLTVEKYRVERLAQGVSLATVHRELACLKSILSKAIDWEKLETFPLKKIKIDLKKETRRERVLSIDEEKRLLDAAAPHLRPMIILALNSGLRRGEVLGLRTEDINFQGPYLIVRAELSKSKKSRRVPLNSTALEVLKPLAQEPGFVFKKSNGQPFKDIGESFKTACKDAKIEGVVFHTLRHTFETRSIERGANIANVTEIMGHSSIGFSLKHYYHASFGNQLRDVELLDEKPAQGERRHERNDDALPASHSKFNN